MIGRTTAVPIAAFTASSPPLKVRSNPRPIPELGFLRTPHKLRCGFRRRLDHRQLFHNSHTLLMEAALAGALLYCAKAIPASFSTTLASTLGRIPSRAPAPVPRFDGNSASPPRIAP